LIKTRFIWHYYRVLVKLVYQGETDDDGS
jgi:hypothetical protein